MIPELVKELINWYRWREKNRRVLVEYHQKVIEVTTEVFVYREYRINNRNLDAWYSGDFNFIFNTGCEVAMLPKKYVYSSGLAHPSKYQSLLYPRKFNTWIADFILF